jgi:hypothetical protein
MSQPGGGAPPTAIPLGARSSDGQFRWDGQQWVPIVGAEATSWTRPLQLATAAWFLLAGVLSAISTVVNLDVARTAARTQLETNGMSGPQLEQAVNLGIAFGVAVTVVLLALYLVTAFGSFRGWTWAFWVALVLLALASLFAIFGLIGLVAGSNSAVSPGWAWLGEGVQLLGLALFVWALVSLIRFGAWARRRPGR